MEAVATAVVVVNKHLVGKLFQTNLLFNFKLSTYLIELQKCRNNRT